MDREIIYHKDSATGTWEQRDLVEQLANCGSEFGRACKWKDKECPEMMQRAFERGLELMDLTIKSVCRNQSAFFRKSSLRELLRLREVLCDFFVGDNNFRSNTASIEKYFSAFAYQYAMRKTSM